MKITTWNVNSINARIDHLVKFIKEDKSDIYMLQELKCTNENFPSIEIEKLKYNCYVNGQKAWNGVSLICKKNLIITNKNIPKYDDENARLIEACKIRGLNIKNEEQ